MFMEVHHEVEVWLEQMSESVSRLSPVSEDSEKAKSQLANTKVWNVQLFPSHSSSRISSTDVKVRTVKYSVQKNKQLQREERLNHHSFRLNNYSLGFYPQTQCFQHKLPKQ